MTSQICFFKLLPVHARAASSGGRTVLRWREIWACRIKSNRSRFIQLNILHNNNKPRFHVCCNWRLLHGGEANRTMAPECERVTGSVGFSALFGEVTVIYPGKYVYRLHSFQEWNGCKNTIQPNRFDVDEISPQNPRTACRDQHTEGNHLDLSTGLGCIPNIQKDCPNIFPLGWRDHDPLWIGD